MKKFSAFLLLPISLILFSAASSKNTIDVSSGKGDFLAIRFNPNDAKVNAPIHFSVNDYSKGKTFYWNFGDGTEEVVTTRPSASHTYSKPGTYRVKVNNGGNVAVDMVMVSD